MKTQTASYFLWLLGCCLIVAVLSIAFAYAPAPARRIGLLYVVYGCLCGAGIRWLADERKVTRTRAVSATACVVVAIGSMNVGWVSYLQLKEVKARELQQDPEQLAILNMLEKIASEQDADDYKQRQRLLQPEFSDYLLFRVSGLGISQYRWAVLVWTLEIVAAAAMAGFIVRRESTVVDIGKQKIEHAEADQDLKR